MDIIFCRFCCIRARNPALLNQRNYTFKRNIRIYRSSTETEQQYKVHHLTRLTTFYNLR